MPLQTDISLIDQAAIDALINNLAQTEFIIPELINLTPKEKLKNHSIKNKREPFVRKTIEVASLNPVVVPAFVSVNYLEEKFTNFQRLKSVENYLLLILERVRDTAHNEGHFAYKEALKIFDSIDLAKDSNVPGIDSLHESLQTFFTKTKKKV